MTRACPGCGATAFRDRRVAPGLLTSTCRCCGLIQSTITRDGPVTAEFALVDERAYLNSVGTVRRRQAADVLDFLRPHVAPGAALLDVGCSFGFFLAEARAAGFDVAGVEPDPQAHCHARRLLGDGVVRHGVLSAATVPERPADIVATLDVLEHIPPDEHADFAAAVDKTLAPRGLWLLKVPSTEGLYYRLSATAARVLPPVGRTLIRRLWQTDYEYPHTVYFDRPSLVCWLNRHGFDAVAWRYLPEVPNDTVIDRLTTDGRISRPQARLMAPALYAVNAVEAARGKSDALLMVARRR